MTEENIEGDAIEKGKNHVIREICKLDRSKNPEELKRYVFSELVKMKKELCSNCKAIDPFIPTGAYSFSSFNVQDDV